MNSELLGAVAAEQSRRDEVMLRILDYIRTNRRIKLPEFDPTLARPNGRYALINVGLEPNDFTGTFESYRYQFEGEEDLLHLIITKSDESPLSPREAQRVASFVLNGLPTALIWLRPGEYSQHFYFGHDELIDNLILPIASD